MANIRQLHVSPALINSSCAWASSEAQLRDLYECQYTGAVTTRTSTLDGFKETAPGKFCHTLVSTGSGWQARSSGVCFVADRPSYSGILLDPGRVGRLRRSRNLTGQATYIGLQANTSGNPAYYWTTSCSSVVFCCSRNSRKQAPSLLCAPTMTHHMRHASHLYFPGQSEFPV